MSQRDVFFSLFSVEIPDNFRPVVIGKICSAYGVLGWLKIVSFTEECHSIISYQPWFINFLSKWKCIHLEKWKKHSDGFRFIVKFKDISDRDSAKLLNNHKIFVNTLQFSRLCIGEYYWQDVMGFHVIGNFGYKFGVVVNLIETGSNDVLVIKNNNETNTFNKIYLIPFIDTVIKNVDFLDRIVTVDWDPKF